MMTSTDSMWFDHKSQINQSYLMTTDFSFDQQEEMREKDTQRFNMVWTVTFSSISCTEKLGRREGVVVGGRGTGRGREPMRNEIWVVCITL